MANFHRRFGSLVLLSGAATLVGFATQMLVAYNFGTSALLDSYWLALAVATALSFYVHPLRESLVQSVFKATKAKDERASEIFTAGIVILLILCAVTALALYIGVSLGLAEPIGVHNSDFSTLLLAFIPFLFFFALSETANAVMLSYNLALPQAWARLVSAAFTMACVGILGHIIGVYALLASLLIGQVIVLLVSWRNLYRNGLRWRYRGLTLLRDQAFMAMFGSLLLNYLLAQSYVFVERLTMTALAPGALSAFLYATLLVNVFVSLLALPLSNLLWPRFLELERDGERDKMPLVAWQSSAPVMFLLLAMILFGWHKAPAVVSVIFERGNFDAASHAKTVAALRMTIFAAVPISMVTIALRALMSQGRSTQVAVVGIIMAVVGLMILGVAFYSRSLPLAQSHWAVANLCGAILAWVWLIQNDRAPISFTLHVGRSILLSLIAVTLPFFILPHFDFGHGFFPLVGALIVKSLIYGAMVLVLAFALRLIDFKTLKSGFAHT